MEGIFTELNEETMRDEDQENSIVEERKDGGAESETKIDGGRSSGLVNPPPPNTLPLNNQEGSSGVSNGGPDTKTSGTVTAVTTTFEQLPPSSSTITTPQKSTVTVIGDENPGDFRGAETWKKLDEALKTSETYKSIVFLKLHNLINGRSNADWPFMRAANKDQAIEYVERGSATVAVYHKGMYNPTTHNQKHFVVHLGRFCALDAPGLDKIRKNIETAYTKEADNLANALRKGALVSQAPDESMEEYVARYMRGSDKLFKIQNGIMDNPAQIFRRLEIAKRELCKDESIKTIIAMIEKYGSKLARILQMTSEGIDLRGTIRATAERRFYGCFGKLETGIAIMPRTAIAQVIQSRWGVTTSKVAITSNLYMMLDSITVKDLIHRPYITYEKMFGVAAEIGFVDHERKTATIKRIYDILASHLVDIIDEKFDRGRINEPGLNKSQKTNWRRIYKAYLENVPIEHDRPPGFAPQGFTDVANLALLFQPHTHRKFNQATIDAVFYTSWIQQDIPDSETCPDSSTGIHSKAAPATRNTRSASRARSQNEGKESQIQFMADSNGSRRTRNNGGSSNSNEATGLYKRLLGHCIVHAVSKSSGFPCQHAPNCKYKHVRTDIPESEMLKDGSIPQGIKDSYLAQKKAYISRPESEFNVNFMVCPTKEYYQDKSFAFVETKDGDICFAVYDNQTKSTSECTPISKLKTNNTSNTNRNSDQRVRFNETPDQPYEITSVGATPVQKTCKNDCEVCLRDGKDSKICRDKCINESKYHCRRCSQYHNKPELGRGQRCTQVCGNCFDVTCTKTFNTCEGKMSCAVCYSDDGHRAKTCPNKKIKRCKRCHIVLKHENELQGSICATLCQPNTNENTRPPQRTMMQMESTSESQKEYEERFELDIMLPLQNELTTQYESLMPHGTQMFATLNNQINEANEIHSKKKNGLMKINSSQFYELEVSASTPHPLAGKPTQIQQSFVGSDKDQLHITDVARPFEARKAVPIEINKPPLHPTQIKREPTKMDDSVIKINFFVGQKTVKENIKDVWARMNAKDMVETAKKLQLSFLLDSCASQHHILPHSQEEYDYFTANMKNLETRYFDAESIEGVTTHKSKLGAYMGVPHDLHRVDKDRPSTRVVTSWGILKAVMQNQVGLYNPPNTDIFFFDFLHKDKSHSLYPVGKLKGRIFELNIEQTCNVLKKFADGEISVNNNIDATVNNLMLMSISSSTDKPNNAMDIDDDAHMTSVTEQEEQDALPDLVSYSDSESESEYDWKIESDITSEEAMVCNERME